MNNFSIQIKLIEAYCKNNNLDRRAGAKIWVQKYAEKCRRLIDSGKNSTESISEELYK